MRLRKTVLAVLLACMLLWFVGAAMASGVSVDASNFPDENFRAYVSNNFDSDGNGVLSDEEISSVTSLYVGYNGISSLQGIEYFTALTYLDCGGNQFTAIDVSKNAALEVLYCYSNQLTTLDISNNTALRSLSCYSNHLAALDINSSADMYELYCGSQTIDGLTLTQTGDESYPYQFSLAGLMSSAQAGNVSDVQGKNLSGSKIETSYSGGTARFASSPATLVYKYDTGCNNSSLDVFMDVTIYDSSAGVEVNEENFPDENFRQYVINNCDNDGNGSLSLTEIQNVDYIHVAYNNISSLKGIEYFSALIQLDCYNNNITELDLSNNTNLNYLNCNNNKLAALDLGSLTNLWNLQCDSQVIDGFTLTETGDTAYPYQLNFSTFMSDNQASNVSNVQAKDAGGSDISAAFSGGTAKFSARPAEISYSYSTGAYGWQTSPDGMTSEYVPILMDVTMYDNSGGVEITADKFPDEIFRQYISSNLDMNSDGSISPAEIRNANYIQVSYNNISSLKGIEYFTALTQLECYNNNITELDLSRNTALSYLECANNMITALDLSKNTKLSYLNCSNNRLESLDVSKNTELYSLYCDGNQITDIDVSSNTNLGYFSCSDNQISELDLSANTYLYSLSCGLNQLTELDVSGNENLSELNCYGNQIYELDLSKNKNLTRLYCYNNQMASLSLNGLENLSSVYCQNNRITFLNISSCPDVYLRCDRNTFILREIVAATKPTITTSSMPDASVGAYFSLQLVADGTYPMTWSSSGKLPDGLTLSESGLLSGIPLKAKSFTVKVKASNEYGDSSKSFSIVVYDPVTITTASLKDGTFGKKYNVTMKAKGSKTITWSAEGLPDGLTMNEKGKISGSPTVNGTFSVKITAENPAGMTRKTLQLKIKGIAPKLSGNLSKAKLGEPYSSSLKATGSKPITWSITGNLPQGLTLNTSTGEISGTPLSYLKSGYKFTITASNDEGKTSKTVTLKVNGTAPSIKVSSLPNAEIGAAYSFTLSAAGSQPITWTADNLPSGLYIDGNTIAGTPNGTAGKFSVTLYAENPVKRVNKKLNLTVNAANTNAAKTTPSDNAGTHENKTEYKSSVPHNRAAMPGFEPLAFNGVLSIEGDYVVAAVLDEISVDLPGLYDFEVELSGDVPESSELIYIANSDMPSSDDELAEFYDDTGAEISAVPENRKITLSVWLNPERIYSPAIAVKK